MPMCASEDIIYVTKQKHECHGIGEALEKQKTKSFGQSK